MAADDHFAGIVTHYSRIEGNDDQHYPNSEELTTISASFSPHLNLMRLGIHHERLLPGGAYPGHMRRQMKKSLFMYLKARPTFGLMAISSGCNLATASAFRREPGLHIHS